MAMVATWSWTQETRKLLSVNNGQLRNDFGQVFASTRYARELDCVYDYPRVRRTECGHRYGADEDRRRCEYVEQPTLRGPLYVDHLRWRWANANLFKRSRFGLRQHFLIKTQCHISNSSFGEGWHLNGRLPTLYWPRVRWALKQTPHSSRLVMELRTGTRLRMVDSMVLQDPRVSPDLLARQGTRVRSVLQGLRDSLQTPGLLVERVPQDSLVLRGRRDSPASRVQPGSRDPLDSQV